MVFFFSNQTRPSIKPGVHSNVLNVVYLYAFCYFQTIRSSPYSYYARYNLCIVGDLFFSPVVRIIIYYFSKRLNTGHVYTIIYCVPFCCLSMRQIAADTLASCILGYEDRCVHRSAGDWDSATIVFSYFIYFGCIIEY